MKGDPAPPRDPKRWCPLCVTALALYTMAAAMWAIGILTNSIESPIGRYLSIGIILVPCSHLVSFGMGLVCLITRRGRRGAVFGLTTMLLSFVTIPLSLWMIFRLE